MIVIGEFMHRYTNITLPNVVGKYFSLALVIHSYHTRNCTQYRSEFPVRMHGILPSKLQAYPSGIISLDIFSTPQVANYLGIGLNSF